MRTRELLHLKSKYILCECGCGEKIREINVNGDKARFKQYHQYGRRDKAISWKGGRVIRSGYFYILDGDRYVAEHRIVWEKYHNAILLPWANVHHINGDKQDNRIENLEAMTINEHSRLHAHPKRY